MNKQPDIRAKVPFLTRGRIPLLIAMALSGHLVIAIRRLNGPLFDQHAVGRMSELRAFLETGLFVEIPFVILIFAWVAQTKYFLRPPQPSPTKAARWSRVATVAWIVGVLQGILLFWQGGFVGPTGYALTVFAWWPLFAAVGMGAIFIGTEILSRSLPLLTSIFALIRPKPQ